MPQYLAVDLLYHLFDDYVVCVVCCCFLLLFSSFFVLLYANKRVNYVKRYAGINARSQVVRE